MTPVLSRRALGRATLARQFLLARTDATVPEVVTHLVGLQAQTPHTWYTGLWSRIDGFTPDQAADPLVNRELVRIAVMRSTIHLVTAEDALALRPVVQPALDRDLFRNYTHGRDMRGLDVDAVVAAGRALLAEKPRTNKELGALLHEQWPDRAPASRSGAWCRWCRSRRAGCGGAAARSRTPAPRPGWVRRWRTSRPRTSWCCATWPRSGPRR
jgi:hypothetical protein